VGEGIKEVCLAERSDSLTINNNLDSSMPTLLKQLFDIQYEKREQFIATD
jgi:hypothetical protein